MDWKDALSQLKSDMPQAAPTAEDEPAPSAAKKLPTLEIVLDRKGRKGKDATIVAGFSNDTTDNEIAAIASQLKQKLGTGGSSRGGEILIQGDKRQAVQQALAAMGYKAKIK